MIDLGKDNLAKDIERRMKAGGLLAGTPLVNDFGVGVLPLIANVTPFDGTTVGFNFPRSRASRSRWTGARAQGNRASHRRRRTR